MADLSHFSSLTFFAISKTYERSRKNANHVLMKYSVAKMRSEELRESFPTREKRAI